MFGNTDPDATPRTKTAERQRRDRLHHLFSDADTQAGIRGTAWAGYQAVAEYIDHFAPVRARRNADVARATRLLTSDQPARLKRTAWAALAPTQG